MALLLRGKMRDGLVVLASLAFGLSIIEATAAVLETRDLLVVTKGLLARQPVIGWGPEHTGRFHAEKTNPKSGVPIYKADYTIDSNLLRETREFTEQKIALKQIFANLQRHGFAKRRKTARREREISFDQVPSRSADRRKRNIDLLKRGQTYLTG